MTSPCAELNVVYDDAHLLVVDKPAGIVVHPSYRNESGTLLDALQWDARNWPDGHRPSIVGRLDKDTSGLVVVAKTAHVHAMLQRTLALANATKTYLAVVYGHVEVARGTIDTRLRVDPADRRYVVVSEAGARCLTRFERLASVAAPDAGLALLRCALVTGRRHQLRVHLSANGWPIVGDRKYGAPHWSRVADPALAQTLRAFPRQALHAHQLDFMHPETGRRVTIEAPVPGDIGTLLKQCGLASSLAAPERSRAT